MAQTNLQGHVLRTTTPSKVRFRSPSTSSAWDGPPADCLGGQSWTHELRHHVPKRVFRSSGLRAVPSWPRWSSALWPYFPIDAQDWRLPPASAAQPPETSVGEHRSL